MAKTLTIVPGVDFVGNAAIASIAEFNQWLTQATYGGVDRDHFATGTNPVVSSSSAPSTPATGLGWHDTATGLVSYWDGSAWIGTVTFTTTAPSTTGTLWYDTTLKMLRRYETRDGLTGWHPERSGAVLADWDGGGSVAVGGLVFDAPTATNFKRVGVGVSGSLTATGRVPLPEVFGIAAEAATNAADQLVVWPNVANVICTVAVADAGTASGDALIATAAGSVREAGPLNNISGDATASVIRQQHGLPAGCFAVALTAASGGTVTAKMLGCVGQGRYVGLSSAGVHGELADLVALNALDGDPHDVAIPTTGFANASHIPYAIRVMVRGEIITGKADLTINFSRTSDFQGNANLDVRLTYNSPSAASGQQVRENIMDIPTNEGGEGGNVQAEAFGHGLFFTYESATVVTAATEMASLVVEVIGYWY